MAGFSYLMRNVILNRILRGPGQPSIRPSDIFFSLFTVNPDNNGLNGTEVPGGVGYARQNVPQLDANWAAPANGASDIINAIAWGAASTSNWGRIIGIGMHDSLTGGIFLGGFPLVVPSAIFRAWTTQNAANQMRLNDHAIPDNTPCFVFGDDMPPELAEGVEYWFKPDGGGSPNPDVFNLRSSFNGPNVVISPQGGGKLAISAAAVVNIGQTFTLSATDLRVALIG